MFLQDTGEDSKSIRGVFDDIIGNFTELTDELIKFDVQARKVVGDTFGQGAEFADKIRFSIAASVKNTAELGYTTDMYAKLLSDIGVSLQRNVDFSSEQLTNMMLFADAAGLTTENLGKLVVEFENIGLGAQSALSEMESMAAMSRRYGLNVSQYMVVISDNLKLINSFKFKDGVDGLANMVAKSQALRINVDTVTQLAEKFLDPEGAINAAASLQMMGGELAKLGDGFQLMNLAQNDVEGLFDALVEATSASVSFNDESGQFELSALEMRRLRATAKELVVDYNELSKGAINFAERQEKLSQIDFMGGVQEEDREFLASIGQLDKTGELKFSVKQGEETKLLSLTELTPKEIEKLRKQQIDSEKDSREIALEQRDLLTKLYNEATRTRKLITAEGIIKEDGQIFNSLKNELDKFGGSVEDFFNEILKLESLNTATTKTFEKLNDGLNRIKVLGSSYEEILTGLARLTLPSFGLPSLQHTEDDLVSLPGYGNRILTGPEGSIQLNNNDTIIAGTDLMGGSQNNDDEQFIRNLPLVAEAFKGVFSKGNMETSSERNFNQLMNNLPKDLSKILSSNNGPIESPRISFEDLQITHSGTIRLEGEGRFLTMDMLEKSPQMLENLTNMIRSKMSSQSLGYNNA